MAVCQDVCDRDWDMYKVRTHKSQRLPFRRYLEAGVLAISPAYLP
jgi:hypothetical protein